MVFDRQKWITWMAQQDRQAEGGRAVFWRPDPLWDHLHRQDWWADLMRRLGRDQKVSVDCAYTAITRGYRAELVRWQQVQPERFHREFLAEGYGPHPLRAVYNALRRVEQPLVLGVRLSLLNAMIELLIEEMEA